MRAIAQALGAALLICGTAAPAAAPEGPEALVRSIVGDVLSAYETGKDRLGSDPDFLRGLVETRVLPHVDFTRMSKLVLAKHWTQASAEQRVAFMDAFREHLVRTYSAPLADYTGQGIEFLPFEPSDDPARATVETVLVPHEATPIPMNYRLRRTSEGTWLIYDVWIDGVSLVGNYRSAYALEIRRVGLDAFVESLAEESK